MHLETIELEEADCFSSTFLEYIRNNKKLSSFYNLPPTLSSFEQQIVNRNFPDERRAPLVAALNKQYKGYIISSNVQQNITSLNNKGTFTVVTGHQLNIFTGPLYFV